MAIIEDSNEITDLMSSILERDVEVNTSISATTTIDTTQADYNQDTLIEDKSPYVCTINLKNPTVDHTFDFTVFSREVFIGNQRREVVHLIDRYLFIFLALQEEHNGDLTFAISIVATDSNGYLIPSSANGAMGDSTRVVHLYDFDHDIVVSCFSKSYVGY